MPVKTARVETRVIQHPIEAIGSLHAAESVMIRPELAGRIAALHFEEGSEVEAGELLVSLDASEWQAQVEVQRADVRLAEQRHERANDLLGKGFNSQQELDEARAELASSRARLREALARLEKTEIRAPFSGRLGLRMVSPGAYVSPGQDIVELDDIRSLKLDFRIPERYSNQLQTDMTVQLLVDSRPAEPFAAVVFATQPGVDERTRSLLVRARVDNTGLQLRPGMFTRVRIHPTKTDPAPVVPEQALVPIGQENFVFRVEDGKVNRIRVDIGERAPGLVSVRQGLTAGDEVVIEGQMKLRDGAPVSVMVDPQAAGG